jgi:hypothetical protein
MAAKIGTASRAHIGWKPRRPTTAAFGDLQLRSLICSFPPVLDRLSLSYDILAQVRNTIQDIPGSICNFVPLKIIRLQGCHALNGHFGSTGALQAGSVCQRSNVHSATNNRLRSTGDVASTGIIAAFMAPRQRPRPTLGSAPVRSGSSQPLKELRREPVVDPNISRARFHCGGRIVNA